MAKRLNWNGKWIETEEPAPAPAPIVPTPAPTPAPYTPTQATAGQLIASPTSPEGPYAKALIPYLSKEDAAGYASTYGGSPTTLYNGSIPAPRYFLSKQRAEGALTALDAARASAGASNTDAGFSFLTNSINLLKQFGGMDEGNGMSRDTFQQFTTAFNELLSHATAAKVPSFYTDLAKAFVNPTFNGQPLMQARTVGNRQIYSTASNKLFT